MEKIEKKQDKPKWWVGVIKYCLMSPVNVLFGLALIYFSSMAYLFEPSLTNKVITYVILGFWIFWFLAKQIFVLMILLCLLAVGGYWYYTYAHQEASKCEDAGGYWNDNKQICEEKIPFWMKLQKMIEDKRS